MTNILELTGRDGDWRRSWVKGGKMLISKIREKRNRKERVKK